MSSMFYQNIYIAAFKGLVNFDTSEFGMMLMTEEFTPDRLQSTRADIQEWEVRGPNYIPGGFVVAAQLITNEQKDAYFEFGPMVMGYTTIAARYGVYYQRCGGASFDNLVFAHDFGEIVECTKGSFTIDPLALRFFSYFTDPADYYEDQLPAEQDAGQ